MDENMTDEELRKNAVGTVNNVKGTATDEEIEAAIAEIDAERDHQDRSGE